MRGRPVDEQIVKMSLDNETFLSKLQNTLSSLTKTVGATKQLDSTKLSNIESNVSGLTNKFSALGVMAFTTIQNITNRAVNMGIQMSKSFTLAPMQEGFQMYEGKLKSIQTILANTEGKENLDSVTKSLDVLNEYANKTVYSFQDMTTNMGTFTAAGVDLKTAQVAIQGIGNLAAVSGSSTQQAGVAMYQLSQALAAGKVNLMDWNSVVNAGMGGKKFQTALQTTAREMGKNVSKSESFRNSLEDGWLTSDVLTKTLAKFANDKSMLQAATQAKTFSAAMDTIKDQLKTGWSNTFEAAIGGFEQAPKIWTAFANSIGDAVDASANARIKLVQDFSDIGGRDVVIGAVTNSFKALTAVVGAIKGAFNEIFPPQTASSLLVIAQNMYQFTKSLIMSGDTADKLKNVFKGVFAAFDIGIRIVKGLGSALLGMIPDGIGKGLLDIASGFADFIISIDDAMKAGNGFSVNLGKVDVVLDSIGSALKKLSSGISSVIGSLSSGDLLAGGALVSIGVLIKKISKFAGAITGIFDSVKSMLNLGGKIDGFFDGLKGTLNGFTSSVNAATMILIASAIMEIAVAVKVISGLDFVDVSKGLEVIIVSLVALKTTLKALSKLDFKGSIVKSSLLIVAVADAILAMSVALKIISTIDTDKLQDSIFSLVIMIGALVGAIGTLSKLDAPMKTGAGSIVLLSTSVVILAGALKIISSINVEGLIKGLVSMAVVLSEVVGFAKLMSNLTISPATSLAMNLIATSLVIMSGAVAIMGNMDIMTLVKGLSSTAIMLAEVAGFAALMSLVPKAKLLSASGAMVAMGVALNLMTPPIIALGMMDPKKLGIGLLGIVGALAAVSGAMIIASKGIAGAAAITVMAVAINMLVPPLAILGKMSIAEVGIALVALAGALAIIGAASLLMTAGSVGLLSFALAISAVALAMAAAGVLITGFSTAIAALSAVTAIGITKIIQNFGELIKGLKTTIPDIVDLAVNTVTSLAEGLAEGIPTLVDSGVKLITGLLQGISDNIYKVITVVAAIITEFLRALTDSLPELIEAGTEMMVAFMNGLADSIRENSQSIIDAVFNIIEAILEAIIDALIKVVDILVGWFPGAKDLFKGFGDSAKGVLRDAFDIKDIGEKGGDDMASGLDSKRDMVHEAGKGLGEEGKKGAEEASYYESGTKAGDSWTQGIDLGKTNAYIKGTELSGATKEGAAFNSDLGLPALTAGSTWNQTLGTFNASSNIAGQNLSSNMKAGVKTNSNLAGQASNAGVSFTSKLGGYGIAAHGAGSKLSSNAKAGAKTNMTNEGSKGGSTFTEGVSSKKGDAHTKGLELSSSGKKGAGSNKDEWHRAGKNVGGGFGKGVADAADEVVKAASRMASGAVKAVKHLLGIKSPSRVFKGIGRFTVQGFSLGIKENQNLAINQASNMALATTNAVSAAMEAANNDMSYHPVITPVLDDKALKQKMAYTGNAVIAANVSGIASIASTSNDNMNQNGSNLVTELLKNKLDQASEQNSIMQSALDLLNDKLEDVVSVVSEGKNTVVMAELDGQLVSKTLGPTMETKLADIKLKDGRLRGEF